MHNWIIIQVWLSNQLGATNMNNQYTSITIEGEETVSGTISCWYTHRVYEAQVDKGGIKIPSRQGSTLDRSKIAQAQAQADWIRYTLFGKN